MNAVKGWFVFMYVQINAKQREKVLALQERQQIKRKAHDMELMELWLSGVPLPSLSDTFNVVPSKIQARIKETLAELFLNSKDKEFDLLIMSEFVGNLRSLIELRGQLRYTYKRKFQAISSENNPVDLEEDDSDKAEIIKVNDSITRTLKAIGVMESKVKDNADAPDTRKDVLAQVISALGMILGTTKEQGRKVRY